LPRWIASIALLVSAHALGATGHVVNVGGAMNVFTPQTIDADPGDTVTFINKGGFHNVVADDHSFRCARGCDGDGQDGSGAINSSLWIVSITVTKPGKLGYFCEMHGSPGVDMFGTINVSGTVAAAPAGPVPTSSPLFLALLIAAIASIGVLVSAARRRRR
jgi:plastocyanin